MGPSNLGKELVCALEGCGIVFKPKVHNQRFHSKECCRIYTNAKILEAYHTKKNRDLTNRVCASKGCSTVLSIYNDNKFCASCEKKQHVKKLRSWGWRVQSD